MPTIKISTNDRLSAGKAGWIDFSAGPVADGEPVPEAAERLLQYVIAVASGEQTAAERRGYGKLPSSRMGRDNVEGEICMKERLRPMIAEKVQDVPCPECSV